MEDIGFEEQLKQEEIQKLKEEESRDKTYKDKDGTEYEWDQAKSMISEDFIAQYQMTYGAHSADPQNGDQQSADQNQEEDGDDKGAPSLEGLDVNSEEYAKRYHEYYAYYYGEDYANYYSYYNQEEVQGEVQAEGQGESESQDGNQKGKKRKKKGEKPDPPPKREEGTYN
ncbi:unnamed protein product [Mytilus edulis]|uniref:Uncharacterized protein n=1 Tax=Mytilus edulis TaxID=6550 RepID=A0A8S3Q286_MYTED|nr:unnamed protein product [Mytilus edulis]